MKVLHILYQSLPQISGSSIRSRDILISQNEIGLHAIAVTAPFQTANTAQEVINGIKYYRTSINEKDTISDEQKSVVSRLFRFFRIFIFYGKLKRIITKEKPQILHAHAMFFCGLPAIILGKKFHVPVVYEVRSLWMLKKKGKPRLIDSLSEKILYATELYVMRKATIVVAINDNLKEELIRKKIDRSKIVVIENAINTTLINSLKKRMVTASTRKVGGRFGYIGTITPHEGIDLLIQAFSEVNLKFPESTLSIFGRGVEENKIKELARKTRNVQFYGSVDPKDIYKAFGVMDIIVNPRYRNKLTESVTPLKPLEAMAYEKLVIGSDVGGIKELVTNQFNGLLFKADKKEDLVRVMKSVLTMEDHVKSTILANALRYVFEEKSWIKNAYRYKSIYTVTIEGHNGR